MNIEISHYVRNDNLHKFLISSNYKQEQRAKYLITSKDMIIYEVERNPQFI